MVCSCAGVERDPQWIVSFVIHRMHACASLSWRWGAQKRRRLKRSRAGKQMVGDGFRIAGVRLEFIGSLRRIPLYLHLWFNCCSTK